MKKIDLINDDRFEWILVAREEADIQDGIEIVEEDRLPFLEEVNPTNFNIIDYVKELESKEFILTKLVKKLISYFR